MGRELVGSMWAIQLVSKRRFGNRVEKTDIGKFSKRKEVLSVDDLFLVKSV